MTPQAIVSREPPLGPRAARAQDAVRQRPEEPCPFRTAFQRDRDRILHTTSFRRLKHKTQVFVAPAGDHYRTRLTHTLEVSAVSRTPSPARTPPSRRSTSRSASTSASGERTFDGSVAHVRMLAARGIVTEGEALRIEAGLESVRAEIAEGTFRFREDQEDIDLNVEKRLTELTGEVGGKLHTGRPHPRLGTRQRASQPRARQCRRAGGVDDRDVRVHQKRGPESPGSRRRRGFRRRSELIPRIDQSLSGQRK